MRVTIEATSQLVKLDASGLCRKWLGTTEAGTKCIVFVPLIAVAEEEDHAEFERELLEQMPPRESDRVLSLREVL